MPDEEQGLVVDENPVEETVTQPPPTPTADEQMKTLEAKLKTLEDEKKRIDEGYKGLQRTLNQKNEEIKKQSDLRTEIEGIKEYQKILAAIVAERGEESPEAIEPKRKQDLLAKFDDIQKQQEAKRKQVELDARQKEYIQQADEVWAKAKALGLPEDDDNLLDIEDYLKAGNLKRAESRVKKLENTKKTEESKPAEEKPEISDEIVEAYLKKKGLLKTDTAVPSGRSMGNKDIIRRYAEGDRSISDADYTKAIGRG